MLVYHIAAHTVTLSLEVHSSVLSHWFLMMQCKMSAINVSCVQKCYYFSFPFKMYGSCENVCHFVPCGIEVNIVRGMTIK